MSAKIITDAQILKLRQNGSPWSTLWLREFAIALGELRTINHPIEDQAAARSRCATLLPHAAKRRRK